MRVNLTIKNISMRHAQKICKYAEKQGITDDKEDIEIEELKSSLLKRDHNSSLKETKT